jgi:hypothetical protein
MQLTPEKPSRRPVRLAINRMPPEAVGKLKWATRVLREVRGINAQAQPSPEETWRRKIWCMRNGFVPMSWDLYNLADNDHREYLSEREREMTWILNWPFAAILDDKLGFYYLLKQLGAPTPEIRALVLRGTLEPLDESRSLDTGTWLRDHLDRLGRLVLKPIWGAKGKGISIIERAGEGCRIDGVPTTLGELEQRLSGMDRYMLTDFAQQAAYAREIFPGSANSIRILTMTDEDRRPFIASAAHRFGAERSQGPVDSWSRGGLSAGIDIETGELAAAVTSLEYSYMERHDHHPDTGTQITGNRVTGWDGIRTGILELATKLPYLPYIGWDVIATDSGYLVIEGNKQSAVGFLQVHRPLLRDPRVRAFYEREGIL